MMTKLPIINIILTRVTATNYTATLLLLLSTRKAAGFKYLQLSRNEITQEQQNLKHQ